MESDLRLWMRLVETVDTEQPGPMMAWANAVDRQNPIKPSPLNKPKREAFKSGKLADFYQKVLRDGGDMFGADESELSMDEVKSWVVTHRKLFQKGGITIFRTMQLTPHEIANLQAGTELGNHWTYEFDENNIEGFNMNLNDKTKQMYVFEATVRTGEVAFPLTVAYNVYFPHEKEIFLDSRVARPKIVTVRYLNLQSFTLDDENVRPDLVGVEMSA
jgi:hypothetical protein